MMTYSLMTLLISAQQGRLYCNATNDSVQCWNYTLAGTKAYGSCPKDHPSSFIFDNPNGFSFRKCESNGQWWNNNNNGTHEFAKSNYLPCVSAATLQMKEKAVTDIHEFTLERIDLVIYINISGYAISIILLLIGLVIFRIFRQLHCKRNTIHTNLFTSYILCGSTWIAFYISFIAKDPGSRPVWCYILHALALYTTLSTYSWMLCEGIFLHFSLVDVFSDKTKIAAICYIVGWVLPVLFIGSYCVARVVVGESALESCWLKSHPSLWILFGPIILSLLLNLIFLVNILRILLTKLQSVNHRNARKYKKTVRALLILVPLLGLQYIMMPLHIDSFLYKVIAAVITSYQGALVAIQFCFLNGEVLMLLKRKIGRRRGLFRGSSRLTERVSMRSVTPRSSARTRNEFTEGVEVNVAFLSNSEKV